MDFVSGWAAGIVAVIVGHPFDTVKVNQQTQGIGTVRCTLNIYQQFGVKGFFRGLAFPMAASGGICSVYFGTYKAALNTLLQLETSLKPPSKNYYTYCFIAGCMSGITNAAIVCPVELVKIQLQTSTAAQTYIGPIRLIRNLVDSHGIRGIYQGLLPTAARTIPGSGIYMLNYELMANWIKQSTTSKVSRIAGIFVAGGVSGTLAWWITLPIDTIKSNIQAQDSNRPKYSGFVDCGRSIVQAQGYAGLFRGFWILPLRSFPVNGAIFITLEGCNYLIKQFS